MQVLVLIDKPEWKEVETSYLFHNQYNLVGNWRVYDKDILAVKDDARIGKGYCKTCHRVVESICPKHPTDGVVDFTEDNTYFIANPDGCRYPALSNVQISTEIGRYKFSSFCFQRMFLWRLSSARKKICFWYDFTRQIFWVSDLIFGWTASKRLDVPLNENAKIISLLTSVQQLRACGDHYIENFADPFSKGNNGIWLKCNNCGDTVKNGKFVRYTDCGKKAKLINDMLKTALL